MSRSKSPFKRVRHAFDTDGLKAVCEMHEEDFNLHYDLVKADVKSAPYGSDFIYYQDNGADVLFVAHLDTVVDHKQRTTDFARTAAGITVVSGALDDRLGAYVGLELLPALGVNHDILLTVGEEMGMSTAQYFNPQKEYNWMIEFDRGGTDVVMYDYEDYETSGLVEAAGAKVGQGSFSDICYLEHMEVKGFNWGVGYQGNYHSVRGFAFLEDTWTMTAKYLKFYEQNAETYLPHEQRPKYGLVNHWSDDRAYGNGHWWDEEDEAKVWAEDEEWAKQRAKEDESFEDWVKRTKGKDETDEDVDLWFEDTSDESRLWS